MKAGNGCAEKDEQKDLSRHLIVDELGALSFHLSKAMSPLRAISALEDAVYCGEGKIGAQAREDALNLTSISLTALERIIKDLNDLHDRVDLWKGEIK